MSPSCPPERPPRRRSGSVAGAASRVRRGVRPRVRPDPAEQGRRGDASVGLACAPGRWVARARSSSTRPAATVSSVRAPARPAIAASSTRSLAAEVASARGHRVVERLRCGSGRAPAGCPGSSSAVACQAPTTACSRSDRLLEQRALDVAGQAGVPAQLEGGEQGQLVAEGLARPRRRPSAGCRRDAGRRSGSRCGGSLRGGGRWSRSWPAPLSVGREAIPYGMYIPTVRSTY